MSNSEMIEIQKQTLRFPGFLHFWLRVWFTILYPGFFCTRSNTVASSIMSWGIFTTFISSHSYEMRGKDKRDLIGAVTKFGLKMMVGMPSQGRPEVGRENEKGKDHMGMEPKKPQRKPAVSLKKRKFFLLSDLLTIIAKFRTSGLLKFGKHDHVWACLLSFAPQMRQSLAIAGVGARQTKGWAPG
ncbi:hypothetical protein B0H19DRAFT_1242979 [Mycena capillaripes]|nr:hypothetical protein B0H19DRAFT_1242979 [Mycena capillaripes]